MKYYGKNDFKRVAVFLVCILLVVTLSSYVYETYNQIPPYERPPLTSSFQRITDGSNAIWPSMQVANINNMFIVWADDRNGHYEIYIKAIDPIGNSLLSDTRLTYSNNSIMPDFKIEDNVVTQNYLDIHLVWTCNDTATEANSDNYDIFYSKTRFNWVGGSYTLSTNKSTAITDIDEQALEPKIDLDQNYAAHIVWTQMKNGSQVRYVKVIDNGQSFTKSYVGVSQPIINANTMSYHPAITYVNGSAHIVWVDDHYYGIGNLKWARIPGASAIFMGNLTSYSFNSATEYPTGLGYQSYNFSYVTSDIEHGEDLFGNLWPFITNDGVYIHLAKSHYYKKIEYTILRTDGVEIESKVLNSESYSKYYNYHPVIICDGSNKAYIAWISGLLNDYWFPRNNRSVFLTTIDYTNVETTAMTVIINGLEIINNATIGLNTNTLDSSTNVDHFSLFDFSPDYGFNPSIILEDVTSHVIYPTLENDNYKLYLRTNKDTDFDEMFDWWEQDYLLDPYGNDANFDFDQDTLTNVQEFKSSNTPQADTDPFSSDTDGDGLTDAEEVTVGLDNFITHPRFNDTDGDGLLDSVELGLAGKDGDNGDTKTDPLLFDTDGDGLWDGSQDLEDDGHNSSDLGEDIDLDGSINDDLAPFGTWGSGELWNETDPNNQDTDNDGVLDGWYVGQKNGVYLFYPYNGLEYYKYLTTGNYNISLSVSRWNRSFRGERSNIFCLENNDLVGYDWDTDDDGIEDGNETYWYGDSDNDGVINAKEIDSDNDLLRDGLEWGLASYPSYYHGQRLTVENFSADANPLSITNMTLWDTDNDLASDGFEDNNSDGMIQGDTNKNGVWELNETWFELDPTDPDTDNDLIGDGEEIFEYFYESMQHFGKQFNSSIQFNKEFIVKNSSYRMVELIGDFESNTSINDSYLNSSEIIINSIKENLTIIIHRLSDNSEVYNSTVQNDEYEWLSLNCILNNNLSNIRGKISIKTYFNITSTGTYSISIDCTNSSFEFYLNKLLSRYQAIDGASYMKNVSYALNEDVDCDGILDGIELRVGTTFLSNDSDSDNITDIHEYNVIFRSSSKLYSNHSWIAYDKDNDNTTELIAYTFLKNCSLKKLNSSFRNSIVVGYTYEGYPVYKYRDFLLVELQNHIAKYSLGSAIANIDVKPTIQYALREVIHNIIDPTNPDSDGDSIYDGTELQLGSNPLKTDSDRDGLGDQYEYLNGLNLSNPDTDGDGMPDGWELHYSFDPNEFSNNDYDSDGLLDFQEFNIGTNPLSTDSDGDNIYDGNETNRIWFRTSVRSGVQNITNYLSDEISSSDWIFFDNSFYTYQEHGRNELKNSAIYFSNNNSKLGKLHDGSDIIQYYNDTSKDICIWAPNSDYLGDDNSSELGVIYIDNNVSNRYNWVINISLINNDEHKLNTSSYGDSYFENSTELKIGTYQDRCYSAIQYMYAQISTNITSINLEIADNSEIGNLSTLNVVIYKPNNIYDNNITDNKVLTCGNITTINNGTNTIELNDQISIMSGNYYGIYILIDQNDDLLPDFSNITEYIYLTVDIINEVYNGEFIRFSINNSFSGGNSSNESARGFWNMELFNGSNPLSTDSDFDMILDNHEDRNLNGVYEPNMNESDPNNHDSDYDGLNDSYERSLEYILSVWDTNIDIDGDFLLPILDTDSDNDNISDFIEITYLNGIYDTDGDNLRNFLDNDSDNDQLSDGYEDRNFDGNITLNETSPLRIDSDNDNIPDGWIDGWGYNRSNGVWGLDNSFDNTSIGYDIRNSNLLVDLDNNMGKDFIYVEGEDINCNGMQDNNETNPSLVDTDYDGLRDPNEFTRVNSDGYWAMVRGDPTANHNQYSYDETMDTIWKLDNTISNSLNGNRIVSTRMSNGLLFLITGEGDLNSTLYCLNETNGRVHWSIHSYSNQYSLSLDNYFLYNIMSTDISSHLICRYQINGTVKWNISFDNIFKFSNITCLNERLVFGFNNYLHCLNASTGALIWNNSDIGANLSTCSISDNQVFTLSANKLTCVDFNNGIILWNYTIINNSFSSIDSSMSIPVILNTYVYAFVTKYFNGLMNCSIILCINRYTGNLVWKKSLPLYTALHLRYPIVFNNKLFLTLTNESKLHLNSSDQIFCFNALNGELLWISKPLMINSLITSSNYYLIGINLNNLTSEIITVDSFKGDVSSVYCFDSQLMDIKYSNILISSGRLYVDCLDENNSISITCLGNELSLNPCNYDTDTDGLSDSLELLLRTNPLDPDSDNDYICDGIEYVNGLSPINPDTDGDYLCDGYYDIDNNGIYSNGIDIGEDTNLNGILNYDELDPLNPDSDNDDLTDGNEEIEYVNWWRGNSTNISAFSLNDEVWSDLIQIFVRVAPNEIKGISNLTISFSSINSTEINETLTINSSLTEWCNSTIHNISSINRPVNVTLSLDNSNYYIDRAFLLHSNQSCISELAEPSNETITFQNGQGEAITTYLEIPEYRNGIDSYVSYGVLNLTGVKYQNTYPSNVKLYIGDVNSDNVIWEKQGNFSSTICFGPGSNNSFIDVDLSGELNQYMFNSTRLTSMNGIYSLKTSTFIPLTFQSDSIGQISIDDINIQFIPFISDSLSSDTDNDHLSDYSEYQHYTSPIMIDSDNDMLPDIIELVKHIDLNPIDSDTDDDLLKDGSINELSVIFRTNASFQTDNCTFIYGRNNSHIALTSTMMDNYNNEPIKIDIDDDGTLDVDAYSPSVNNNSGEVILSNNTLLNYFFDGTTKYINIVNSTKPLTFTTPDGNYIFYNNESPYKIYITNHTDFSLITNNTTVYRYYSYNYSSTTNFLGIEPIISYAITRQEVYINYADSNDYDGDGLLDTYENQLDGVLYNDSDSDDDGLSDGYEILISKTNPILFDTDSDGLSDGCELGITTPIPYRWSIIGWIKGTDSNIFISDTDSSSVTNPLIRDTDHDGIPDGWIDGWAIKPKESFQNGIKDSWEGEDLNCNGKKELLETDPISLDTDCDQLPDGWERMNELNPLSNILANGTYGDPDQDQLVNILEYLGNSHELTENTVYWGGTYPNDPDSDTYDNNGMPDGWEYQYNYDPRNNIDDTSDYDLDGLTNSFEYWYYNNHSLSPTLKDSDGDGINDNEELNNNTNPIDPDSDNDGISDGREINGWNTTIIERTMNGHIYSTKVVYSDPLSKDMNSDNDELVDAVEYSLGTDPTSNDSDNDGILDHLDDHPITYDYIAPTIVSVDISHSMNNEMVINSKSNAEYRLGDYVKNYLFSITDENEIKEVYISDKPNSIIEAIPLGNSIWCAPSSSLNPIKTMVEPLQSVMDRKITTIIKDAAGNVVKTIFDSNKKLSNVITQDTINELFIERYLDLSKNTINEMKEQIHSILRDPFSKLNKWNWDLVHENIVNDVAKYPSSLMFRDGLRREFSSRYTTLLPILIKIQNSIESIERIVTTIARDISRESISNYFYSTIINPWERYCNIYDSPSWFDVKTDNYLLEIADDIFTEYVLNSLNILLPFNDENSQQNDISDHWKDISYDSFGESIDVFDSEILERMLSFSSNCLFFYDGTIGNWKQMNSGLNPSSNPNVLDTDNDGLPDQYEKDFSSGVVTGRLFSETNILDPSNPDSNNNGIIDGDEDLDWNSIYNKLQPDGISNYDEYLLHTLYDRGDPNVPDIWVEIDWMKDSSPWITTTPFKYALYTFFLKEYGIPGLLIAIILNCIPEIELPILYSVKPFREHGIQLHFDYGQIGSSKNHHGGERFSFYDVEFPGLEIKTGNNNDFYDFKWGNDWNLDNDEHLDIFDEDVDYALYSDNDGEFDYIDRDPDPDVERDYGSDTNGDGKITVDDQEIQPDNNNKNEDRDQDGHFDRIDESIYITGNKFDYSRRFKFHYCLCVNSLYNDIHGEAEWGDDLIMMTFPGSKRRDEKIGQIFMHEFGHNLGLDEQGWKGKSMFQAGSEGQYRGIYDYTDSDWESIDLTYITLKYQYLDK